MKKSSKLSRALKANKQIMFPGATLPLLLDGRPKRQMHETLVVPEAIQHHVSAATTFGVQHTAHRKVPGE